MPIMLRIQTLTLLLISAVSYAQQQNATPTQVPPTTGINTVYSVTDKAALAPATNTAFTYTTPTTVWRAPSFPTASPLPACSSFTDLCPSKNGQRCADSMGATYGVVCDVRFSGTVITSFGKHKMEKKDDGEMVLEKRDVELVQGRHMKRAYYSSLDYCLQSCDQYNSTLCVGADFQDGTCMAFSGIFGTLQTTGKVALVRQS